MMRCENLRVMLGDYKINMGGVPDFLEGTANNKKAKNSLHYPIFYSCAICTDLCDKPIS